MLISHKHVKVPSVLDVLWNDIIPGTLADTGTYGVTLDGMLNSGNPVALLIAELIWSLACNMTKFPTVYIDDAVIDAAAPPGLTTEVC